MYYTIAIVLMSLFGITSSIVQTRKVIYKHALKAISISDEY